MQRELKLVVRGPRVRGSEEKKHVLNLRLLLYVLWLGLRGCGRW